MGPFNHDMEDIITTVDRTSMGFRVSGPPSTSSSGLAVPAVAPPHARSHAGALLVDSRLEPPRARGGERGATGGGYGAVQHDPGPATNAEQSRTTASHGEHVPRLEPPRTRGGERGATGGGYGAVQHDPGPATNVEQNRTTASCGEFEHRAGSSWNDTDFDLTVGRIAAAFEPVPQQAQVEVTRPPNTHVTFSEGIQDDPAHQPGRWVVVATEEALRILYPGQKILGLPDDSSSTLEMLNADGRRVIPAACPPKGSLYRAAAALGMKVIVRCNELPLEWIMAGVTSKARDWYDAPRVMSTKASSAECNGTVFARAGRLPCLATAYNVIDNSRHEPAELVRERIKQLVRISYEKAEVKDLFEGRLGGRAGLRSHLNSYYYTERKEELATPTGVQRDTASHTAQSARGDANVTPAVQKTTTNLQDSYGVLDGYTGPVYASDSDDDAGTERTPNQGERMCKLPDVGALTDEQVTSLGMMSNMRDGHNCAVAKLVEVQCEPTHGGRYHVRANLWGGSYELTTHSRVAGSEVARWSLLEAFGEAISTRPGSAFRRQCRLMAVAMEGRVGPPPEFHGIESSLDHVMATYDPENTVHLTYDIAGEAHAITHQAQITWRTRVLCSGYVPRKRDAKRIVYVNLYAMIKKEASLSLTGAMIEDEDGDGSASEEGLAPSVDSSIRRAQERDTTCVVCLSEVERAGAVTAICGHVYHGHCYHQMFIEGCNRPIRPGERIPVPACGVVARDRGEPVVRCYSCGCACLVPGYGNRLLPYHGCTIETREGSRALVLMPPAPDNAHEEYRDAVVREGHIPSLIAVCSSSYVPHYIVDMVCAAVGLESPQNRVYQIIRASSLRARLTRRDNLPCFYTAVLTALSMVGEVTNTHSTSWPEHYERTARELRRYMRLHVDGVAVSLGAAANILYLTRTPVALFVACSSGLGNPEGEVALVLVYWPLESGPITGAIVLVPPARGNAIGHYYGVPFRGTPQYSTSPNLIEPRETSRHLAGTRSTVLRHIAGPGSPDAYVEALDTADVVRQLQLLSRAASTEGARWTDIRVTAPLPGSAYSREVPVEGYGLQPTGTGVCHVVASGLPREWVYEAESHAPPGALSTYDDFPHYNPVAYARSDDVLVDWNLRSHFVEEADCFETELPVDQDLLRNLRRRIVDYVPTMNNLRTRLEAGTNGFEWAHRFPGGHVSDATAPERFHRYHGNRTQTLREARELEQNAPIGGNDSVVGADTETSSVWGPGERDEANAPGGDQLEESAGRDSLRSTAPSGLETPVSPTNHTVGVTMGEPGASATDHTLERTRRAPVVDPQPPVVPPVPPETTGETTPASSTTAGRATVVRAGVRTPAAVVDGSMPVLIPPDPPEPVSAGSVPPYPPQAIEALNGERTGLIDPLGILGTGRTRKIVYIGSVSPWKLCVALPREYSVHWVRVLTVDSARLSDADDFLYNFGTQCTCCLEEGRLTPCWHAIKTRAVFLGPDFMHAFKMMRAYLRFKTFYFTEFWGAGYRLATVGDEVVWLEENRNAVDVADRGADARPVVTAFFGPISAIYTDETLCLTETLSSNGVDVARPVGVTRMVLNRMVKAFVIPSGWCNFAVRALKGVWWGVACKAIETAAVATYNYLSALGWPGSLEIFEWLVCHGPHQFASWFLTAYGWLCLHPVVAACIGVAAGSVALAVVGLALYAAVRTWPDDLWGCLAAGVICPISVIPAGFKFLARLSVPRDYIVHHAVVTNADRFIQLTEAGTDPTNEVMLDYVRSRRCLDPTAFKAYFTSQVLYARSGRYLGPGTYERNLALFNAAVHGNGYLDLMRLRHRRSTLSGSGLQSQNYEGLLLFAVDVEGLLVNLAHRPDVLHFRTYCAAAHPEVVNTWLPPPHKVLRALEGFVAHVRYERRIGIVPSYPDKSWRTVLNDAVGRHKTTWYYVEGRRDCEDEPPPWRCANLGSHVKKFEELDELNQTPRGVCMNWPYCNNAIRKKMSTKHRNARLCIACQATLPQMPGNPPHFQIHDDIRRGVRLTGHVPLYSIRTRNFLLPDTVRPFVREGASLTTNLDLDEIWDPRLSRNRKIGVLVGFGVSGWLPDHQPLGPSTVYLGLVGRTFVATPVPDPQTLDAYRDYVERWILPQFERGSVRRMDDDSWLQGQKRRVELTAAMIEYRNYGIGKDLDKIGVFPKSEWICGWTGCEPGSHIGQCGLSIKKIRMKVRIIYTPKDALHVVYGPYVKPIANALKATWHVDNTLHYASSDTPEILDDLLQKHVDRLQNGRFGINGDFSTFEVTKSKGVNDVRDVFFDHLWDSRDADLEVAREALRHMTIKAKSHGVKFSGKLPPGVLTSGEDGTTAKNGSDCLIAMSCALSAGVLACTIKEMARLPHSKLAEAAASATVAGAGDDSLSTATEADGRNDVSGKDAFCEKLGNELSKVGFVAKLTHYKEPYKAVFLGMRPYHCTDGRYHWGPTLGRRLYKHHAARMLSGDPWDWLKQVADAELRCFGHVPILREMAEKTLEILFRETGGLKPLRRGEWEKTMVDTRAYEYTLKGLMYSDKCLDDLSKIYGITVEDINDIIRQVKRAKRLPFMISGEHLDKICSMDN